MVVRGSRGTADGRDDKRMKGSSEPHAAVAVHAVIEFTLKKH